MKVIYRFFVDGVLNRRKEFEINETNFAGFNKIDNLPEGEFEIRDIQHYLRVDGWHIDVYLIKDGMTIEQNKANDEIIYTDVLCV